MTTRPSIDHTILSPSGRVSKRARAAALKREHDRLFPRGYWDEPKKTDAELAKEKATALRRSAATLRDLAARGMATKRYLKQAAKLEADAAELEASLPAKK